MQVKIVTCTPNWDSKAENCVVAFDSSTTEAEIHSQLDMYILEDNYGEVSVKDFDIDIQLQVVRRRLWL